MSVAATVWDVERGSCGDNVEPCWTVTVAVPQPSAWTDSGKLEMDTREGCSRKAWGGPPVAIGERVTVPVHSTDQHLVVHRPGGDVRVKLFGYVRDPHLDNLSGDHR